MFIEREYGERLSEELEPNFPVRDAIILAGGQGRRLGLVDRPKPMAEINGKPIIGYQIEEMRKAGIKNVIFAAGFKSEVLADHVGAGERYGISAKMSIEDTPLGRGGAIKKAMRELPGNWEYVIATNGDNIWRIDLKSLVRNHIERSAIATIVVVRPMSPYGEVQFDEETERVTRFVEKPRMEKWINAGVYVLSKEIEPLLPKVGDIETATFPKVVETGRFYVHRSYDYWRGIDTQKNLEEAREEVNLYF